MIREVVMIDIDDLGVDTLNIRGGDWDYNEEFVQDVRNNGINSPLLVRPAEGGKYAIICGSRRYNAAIEAGLIEVPCFIEEMDDVTALGRTIAENIHRRETPAWRYAVKIGQMYERLNHKGNKENTSQYDMSLCYFCTFKRIFYVDMLTPTTCIDRTNLVDFTYVKVL